MVVLLQRPDEPICREMQIQKNHPQISQIHTDFKTFFDKPLKQKQDYGLLKFLKT
jgi:hypothetical protein